MKKNREKLFKIIFGAETPAGKAFDVVLIFLILLSILAVLLESVNGIQEQHGIFFKYLEWIITILFTVEYFIRIWVVRHPRKFIFSFYGMIDFLSFLPSYLGLIFTGAHGLMVIRALRLLRVFRVLKLNRYVNESNYLVKALVASRFKISIFLYAVIMLIIIIGALMYLVEGKQHGFDSIPRSMYWVVVTITTVGFGDITPETTLGQFIASFIMILGYAIIAVPTGIVTAEMGRAKKTAVDQRLYTCQSCQHTEHDADAKFCKKCGHELPR